MPTWVLASTTKHDAGALVITVRPLSSSQMLRCQGFITTTDDGDARLAVEAAKLATLKVKGPELLVDDPAELDELLERLAPADLAALGGWVLMQSLALDPTATAD